MDFDLSSRPLQLKILAAGIFSVVLMSVSLSGFELEDSPGNAIVSVDEKFRGGNLGTNHIYEVSLENGSTFSYESYTSNHPLCPEQPEKCGEDSQDPGWSEINRTLNSENFKEVEENVFRPSEDICLVSRTSLEAC